MSAHYPAKILVVDDEGLVAREIAESLEELGYRVPGTAATADEAMELARRSEPDLVLLDIRIQGPRDGIETAHSLREKLGVPVVYLTACTDAETLRRATSSQPYAYLIKPVKPIDLRSTVEVALSRARIDRELLGHTSWLSTTLKAIADAIVSVDAEGRITFMNHAAQQLTGWSERDAMGRPADEVVVLIDAVQRSVVASPLGEALRTRERASVRSPSLLRGAQGLEFAIEDSAAPILDGSNRVLGAVMIFRDVSEARYLRQQAELNDRLAALGTLAAGVAHEVNNPLSFIIGNQQYARDELTTLQKSVRRGNELDKDDLLRKLDSVGAALKDALAGCERVRVIVSELKKLGRPTTPNLSSLDVRAVLDSALGVTHAELAARARVVREFDTCPRVRADETRLNQVFVNLLLNAAQSIAPGRVDTNEIRVVTSTNARGGATIEVRDTGSGISRELVPRIFEPFFTTRALETGSGLGLSVSHGIVTSLGGTLEVESRVGSGSTFRVTLPASANASSYPPPARQSEPPLARHDGSSKRLLFIDDERILLDALVRALDSYYTIDTVTSAKAALGLFENGREYDLVVCDLMMPGMTGMDLFERMNRSFPSLAARTVFMTGGAFTPGAQKFLGSVQRRVLEKPFSNNELVDFVAQSLRGLHVVRSAMS
jgi:PAS domain S-box-containing protein